METKKERKNFTIWEYEKEQDYLREQHKQGWKFVKISGFLTYYFEKCNPEDVVYQLDYNQEGIAHKDEYVQMFKDCGWEYMMDFMGYSYFRKPASEMNGDEEIFCDENSRLEMMNRIFKGRMIPIFIILFLIAISQLIFCFTVYQNYTLASVYAILIIFYIVIFAQYSTKFRQYNNEH